MHKLREGNDGISKMHVHHTDCLHTKETQTDLKNNLTKHLEYQEEITLKMSRRQYVIKLIAEINKIQPINNTKISKIKSFLTKKK